MSHVLIILFVIIALVIYHVIEQPFKITETANANKNALISAQNSLNIIRAFVSIIISFVYIILIAWILIF
jgi:ABC-type sulfate transport system permease component